MSSATAGYMFSQQPRAVRNNRVKYRPQDFAKTNMMHDRRIVRGNTYAVEVQRVDDEAGGRPASAELRKTSRVFLRRKHMIVKKQSRAVDTEVIAPSWVHLEELEAPVKAKGAAAGPDDEDDDSGIPFMPKLAGTDTQTMVEAQYLFDFDLAAETVLMSIVGKSLAQAKIEVHHEEQLKMVNNRQSLFVAERGTTFTEAERLEKELKRGDEEVARRVQQQKDAHDAEALEMRAHYAREAAASYYASLQDSVMSRLAAAGHFHEPVADQIKTAFMPWLLENIGSNLVELEATRDAVDRLLAGSVAQGFQEVKDKREAERLAAEAEAARLQAEEEERIRLEEKLAEEAAIAAEEARLQAEREANEGDGAAEGGEGDEAEVAEAE